jgi:transposase
MRHSGISSPVSSPGPAQAAMYPYEPRQRMVISCRSGWVRDAWWSTVPSVMSLTRLDGTGMPSSAADPPAREETSVTGPAARPVRMTIKRERKLRQIIAAGTGPQRLVLRARIILAAAAGDPNAKIARDLGCSENTAREWRNRFAGQGIPGIFDKPRSGRPEIHGPSVRLLIVATATPVPPDGESCWSQESIVRHLRERGLEVSRATAGRALADAKVRPHRVRGWLNRKDDPAFWAQAGAVCRLYLNPPPGTVLASIDEKTGIQAKTRGHPDIPARPGRDAGRESEYARHGTVSIIAAMNTATGEVIS